MKLSFAASVSFLVVLFLFASNVAAVCRCFGGSNPCEFFRAPGGVAFIGTVSEVADAKEKYGQPINGRARKITIKVDEMLKGSLPSQVVTSDDGYRCDNFPFALGKTYLVYANGIQEGTENILPVGLCSGTALAEDSRDAIALLRQMRGGSMPSILSGKVQRVLRGENNFEPIANTKVVLTKVSSIEDGRSRGPKKRRQLTTTTDSEGNYRFENFEAGQYKLEPAIPSDLWIPGTRVVAAGGSPYCQNLSFSAFPNGRISGNVVHADGTPAPRVTLLVQPLDLETRYYHDDVRTDENGNFVIRGLPEGSYNVYASLQSYEREKNKPSPFDTQYPFWSWYFPNTFHLEQAQAVKIGHAESIENMRLKMPPMPVKRIVAGSVKWEDGKTPEKAIVTYRIRIGSDTFHPRYIDTDAQGRFSFEIFGEFEYEMMAANNSATVRGFSAWTLLLKGNLQDGVTLVIRRPTE